MNRYQSSTPRVAAAIAAVAMTLVTIGVAIVVPATIESGGEGMRAQAMNVPSSATDRIVVAVSVDTLHQA